MVIAKEIMRIGPHAINPDAKIQEALELMVKQGISGLPVVDENQSLLGIINEMEILWLAKSKNKSKVKMTEKFVKDFMTSQVVTFTEDDDIKTITDYLIEHNFNRVLIIREQKLVGSISKPDILNYILQNF